MKKYAVIVVDMLNDFVTGPIASPRVHHIIQPIKEFKVWGPHAVEGTYGALEYIKNIYGGIICSVKDLF